MSTINLEKDTPVSLIDLSKGSNSSKHGDELDMIRVKMTWDDTGHDLDAGAMLCKMNSDNTPILVSNDHCIYYGNLKAPQKTVVHSGDNLTGGSAHGVDGEEVTIHFDKLDAEGKVDFIDLIINVYSGGANFNSVKNGAVYITDANGEILASYALGATFGSAKTAFIGSVSKVNGQWAFTPKAETGSDGFSTMRDRYLAGAQSGKPVNGKFTEAPTAPAAGNSGGGFFSGVKKLFG